MDAPQTQLGLPCTVSGTAGQHEMRLLNPKHINAHMTQTNTHESHFFGNRWTRTGRGKVGHALFLELPVTRCAF